MNKVQMLFTLGGFLVMCAVLGLFFILIGVLVDNPSTLRIVFVALGIILFVTGAYGAKNLRKLKYG